jgi:hypothetical protein
MAGRCHLKANDLALDPNITKSPFNLYPHLSVQLRHSQRFGRFFVKKEL